MNKSYVSSFLILLFASISSLFAQTGLDLYFGTNGKVVTDIGKDGSIGQAMLVQTDGKIIVGGYTSNSGLDYDFALVRYNSNGSLDQTFGVGGKVSTPIGSSSDFGKSIALQADGKILLGGYSSNGNNADFALVRYNNNGTLDLSFGENGKIVTDIANFNDYAKSLAIQSNGKIVLTGQTYNGRDYDFATIRYNTNGTLDHSFGRNGIVITDINNDNNNAEALAIDFFGNILIAGYSSMEVNKDISVLRYTSNGILDKSFNGCGKVIMDIDHVDNTANAILLQQDGRILVAGYSNNDEYNGFALLRLTKNGKLDYDFGDNGKITTSLEKDGTKGTTITLQEDGKIVVGGYMHNSNDYDFALLRFTANGNLDASFADNGKLYSSIQNSNDYCYAVSVQQDGKILVAGNTTSGPAESFAVLRYGIIDHITSNNTP